MTRPSLVLPLSDCRDATLVGGKAIHLAELFAAGLPVPGGFLVTTAAYRLTRDNEADKIPPELADAVTEAYQQMGSPLVAVRSSATAEDLDHASMAGQYETYLNVQGNEALLQAVQDCWRSIRSERLTSYLRRHDIDPAEVAMAVVVQQMVPADAAGVLFTADPSTGDRGTMIVEASWGVGETVVSGLVQPDRATIDRESGAVQDYSVSEKRVSIEPGSPEPTPVAESKRSVACLTPDDLRNLWSLGCQVEQYYGAPQDIEWAIHDGNVYLLQSRAITTVDRDDAHRRHLQSVRDQVRQWRESGRGPWIRHNISETLSHPTPLTWSVIRRFMSGDGGFGQLYRTVGCEPSPTVCEQGFLDLVAGRIYMDVSRAGEMFFAGFPFAYDVDLLRCDPDAGQRPPTLPSGSWRERARARKRLAAIDGRLKSLAGDCDQRVNEELVPEIVAWVHAEKSRDVAELSASALRDLWRDRVQQVFDRFAPRVLLPSMIAAMAVEQLRSFLAEHFWEENPLGLLNRLAVSRRADRTMQANQAMFELAGGRQTLEQWLADYGHRGPDEFDLAAPRWRERPDDVVTMAARLQAGESPETLRLRQGETARQTAAELETRLAARDRREFRTSVDLVQRYLPFREDGKYYLILGCDLLRDVALEAGKRLHLGDDVFLLSKQELIKALEGLDSQRSAQTSSPEGTAAVAGQATEVGQASCLPSSQDACSTTIRDRRSIRSAQSRLVLPHMIADSDILSLGDPPPPPPGRAVIAASPISAGVCAGPALIVRSPGAAGPLSPGYVLVCPSTDPSWTPLFVNAAGLVLECGGMLSHGAVVARELGIPAVVSPDATRSIEEGETIHVDGHRGTITRGATATEEAAPPDAEPDNVLIAAELTPPPQGRGERRAATLFAIFLTFWSAYLLAVFLFPPAWLYDPSMRALDSTLWPLVTWLGKPGAVAVIAGAMAALTLIGQRLLTDHRRLVAAKQRANTLRREAGRLPPDCPRQKALQRMTGPVSARVLAAAFVPLAVLLGPMIMTFVWLPQRVDPATWNPQPGAVAYVTASIDGEYLGPVTLETNGAIPLDTTTPATQSLPPIRPTLEKLLDRWREGQTVADRRGPPNPASVVAGSNGVDLVSHCRRCQSGKTRGRSPSPAMLEDLQTYLQQPIPPQEIAWAVRTPAEEPARYTFRLTTQGGDLTSIDIIVGDRFPPPIKEDLGDGPIQVIHPDGGSSPVRLVTVTYQEQREIGDRVFWAPLKMINDWGVPVGTWAHWDAGWLLTYILAYLAALFPLRWLLRIP